MTIYNNLETFLDKPIVDWEIGSKIEDPQNTAYRLRLTGHNLPKDSWKNLFESLVIDSNVWQLENLIIGQWQESFFNSATEVINPLVEYADCFASLKAIFFGDIAFEECLISWIEQSDITPLLDAYPKLEYLAIRGGKGLNFSPTIHYDLKTLIIQTGGLPKEVIDGICKSDLPLLEHLELWLGINHYGGNSTIEDIKPILSGTLFPQLKNLGLCNSQYQDAIVETVCNSPILANLKVLNLSLGALSDKGAVHLLACPEIKGLELLDLHHHFCSKKMIKKIQQLGINVNLDESKVNIKDYDYDATASKYYYTAIGE